MASTQYGTKLSPSRRTRVALGLKASRQMHQLTIDPATASAGHIVNVKFPKLRPHDVIVPGTVRLAFNITLASSTDANRTVVKNLGRAIISRAQVKIGNYEVTDLHSSDVFGAYADLWHGGWANGDAAYRGISRNNSLALRVGAGDGVASNITEKAESDAYGNRFSAPLDFGLLSGHAPFHPDGLDDWFTYTLTFASNERVIRSTDQSASYILKNLTLEYETVNHEGLALDIRSKFQGNYPVHFTDIQLFRKETLDLTSPTWAVSLNAPRRSTTAIVLLFVDPDNDGGYVRDPERFINPNITQANITIEGAPNQLYAQGFKPYQHWDEASRIFGSGTMAMGGGRLPMIGAVAKELNLHGITLGAYLVNMYAFVLDLRSTDDDSLHGSGRKLGNGSVGMTIEMTRTPSTEGKVVLYHYVLSDKQLNFKGAA